jgi:serine/threonine protein kinase
MSPEQLMGEDLSVDWDLWALSVVAYEILTGALPFAANRGDGRKAVLSGNFTPLREQFDNPPERWLSFFDRCFAVDRAARPQSAAEFFYHIEQAFL